MRDLVPLLLLSLPVLNEAHVALTFPDARFPALDFLDTSRTSGPCGVPKPRQRECSHDSQHLPMTSTCWFPHRLRGLLYRGITSAPFSDDTQFLLTARFF
ncbi:unnamed protein product [Heligmosomoides polygyrus]|uniref:Secreted protein n=1 Tax=Heligmosomoides polygyrus TaxID=6339 RepID=A0A183GVG4_HELPZ|nr:unnamed protein product [Heligmosomoides polygyrus]